VPIKTTPNERQFAGATNAFDLLKVYGCGLTGVSAVTPPSCPVALCSGIIFDDPTVEPFTVEDVYAAAHRLQKAADTFNSADKPRPPTRQTLLFHMVAVGLLKTFSLSAHFGRIAKRWHGALPSPSDPAATPPVRRQLLNAAIGIIDAYI